MKILYISRLFTGLEQSVIDKVWRPTGVPTVYKLIESLDKKFDLKIILNHKGGYFRNLKIKKSPIFIKGIKNEVHILGKLNILILNNFSNKIISELLQLSKHIFFYFKYKPDLIYIDNSNIISAAFFSRFFKTPVCLRIMGVYPVMKNYYKKNDITSTIYKFLYRSPFKIVIGTQDGSGTEHWMKLAINKNTPTEILINGVEKKIKLNKSFDHFKKNLIGFIGKLEKPKGADVFVDVAISYLKCKKDFDFYLVGSGTLYNELKDKVKSQKLENHIKFYEYLDHSSIYSLLNKTSIYVSLNKYGSLSNVNIEAISLQKTIIILESDKEEYIDLFVDNFIGNDCVIRIDRKNIYSALLTSLNFLSLNPNKINFYSNNIEKVSNKIKSWDERINYEIKLLYNIYDKNEI